MADRLDHNADASFGGAFVIIPPEGAVQDMLILDSSRNAAIFWSTLQTRAQIALQELQDAERQGGAFPARRM
jgi:hypothetical protein